MNRLPPPCIIDATDVRFPRENHANGQTMKEIWRADGEQVVRCRMRDIKSGDLFFVRSNDPADNQWYVADGDAWFYSPDQCWGITAHLYEQGDDNEAENQPCNSPNAIVG